MKDIEDKARRKRIACHKVGGECLIYKEMPMLCWHLKSQETKTPKVKPEGTKPTMTNLTLKRKVGG